MMKPGKAGENQGKDFLEWLEWARSKADWYDPFVEIHDDLPDAIDRETLAAPSQRIFVFEL
jgi:hypothetical protein